MDAINLLKKAVVLLMEAKEKADKAFTAFVQLRSSDLDEMMVLEEKFAKLNTKPIFLAPISMMFAQIKSGYKADGDTI